MRKNTMKTVFSAFLGLSLAILASCVYHSQPRESHPTQSNRSKNETWHPKDRFEKACYNDGFKPGTSEFGVCVEKHRESLVRR